MPEQETVQASKRGPHPLPSWEEKAKRLLKAEMERKGATFKALSRELEREEIYETAAQLNRKINRGKFSAGFFFACLAALEVREIAVPEGKRAMDRSGEEPAAMA